LTQLYSQPNSWKPVIGLEVHAQLNTKSKLFCPCSTSPGDTANKALCPVCMGHPGAMPCLNAEAVHLALRAGLALGMRLHARSRFDRKHYFYPDTPKGYQLTQQEWPICTSGRLHLRDGEELVPFIIERLHIEEDSGRLQHHGEQALGDWNRAGIPLIEIVGAPDLESPEQAEDWFRMLHRVLVVAGVCGGAMEKGELRCDANISLKSPNGSLGARIEVKNLNSFRNVRRALQHEVERLGALLQSGEQVVSETRAWTGDKTVLLRPKEQTADYRFMPEPDLPDLVLTDAMVGPAVNALPGLPPLDVHLLRSDDDTLAKWMKTFGLAREQVTVLTRSPDMANFFGQCVESGGKPEQIAQWIQRDVTAQLKKRGVALSETPLSPAHILELQAGLDQGTITRAVALRILEWVMVRGGDIQGLVAIQGLERIRDAARIQALVAQVLAEHTEQVTAYAAGRSELFGFLMGELRSASKGCIDPRDMTMALSQALEPKA